MSLFRQLALAITLAIALSLGISLVANVLNARSYLTRQLNIKNQDSANALALSMSQLDKDPGTLELQLLALFEEGQYKGIRVTNHRGEAVVEKNEDAPVGGVPQWFQTLLHLDPQPGRASISDGERLFGAVEVISADGDAYRDLYHNSGWLLAGFACAGLLVGGLSGLILGRIRRPLASLVGQAEAIAERRFLQLPLPKTPELRRVASAMNRMAEALQQAFAEEAARLERLNQALHTDALTGLPNRGHFMGRLGTALDIQRGQPRSLLILIRLRDLAERNRKLGYAQTNTLINELANELRHFASTLPTAGQAARLGGADFALLLKLGQGDHGAALLASLDQQLQPFSTRWAGESSLLAIGATDCHGGEESAVVLGRADTALAQAENDVRQNPNLLPAQHEEKLSMAGEQWRQTLTTALAQGQVRTISYPIVCIDPTHPSMLAGEKHHECFSQIYLADQARWLPAAEFIPHLRRWSLEEAFDLAVVDEAIRVSSEQGQACAVNLFPENLARAGFVYQLTQRLQRVPQRCSQLYLETDFAGALANRDAFCEFAGRVGTLGCRIGLDHCGLDLEGLAGLYGLGIDYLKISPHLLDGLAEHRERQQLLRELCAFARRMDIDVFAQGVTRPEELGILAQLGIRGVSGPLIKE